MSHRELRALGDVECCDSRLCSGPMPFGMFNAPVTFQRLIEVVLAGLLWKECFAYIDDMLVSSPDFESHLAHLQEVFD